MFSSSSSISGSSLPIPADPPKSREELEGYFASFTNYEAQKSLPSNRRAYGPARCRALLDRLPKLPQSTRVIQVAGSKGKGSTVLWMEALLETRGVTVTASVSPHLEFLEERIRRGGDPISPIQLTDAIARLHPAVVDLARDTPELRPTFFDLMTAATVSIAIEGNTPWLLLEVGLGGPLDSSSAVPHHVGVLTTVDLEHRAILGNTLEEIAREKARISQTDRPFVIAAGESQSTEALEAAKRVGEERGAIVQLAGEDSRIPPSVPAPQRHNLAVALKALESESIARFDAEEVTQATAKISLPGRSEILTGPPRLLLDGAHTLRSVEYFAAALDQFREGRTVRLLVGCQGDKEWESAFKPLLVNRDIHWIVTRIPGPRGLDPEKLAQVIEAADRTVDTLPLDRALAQLEIEDKTVPAVTGSMHLAGIVRSHWRKVSMKEKRER